MISVIMPSYLGVYKYCASDRDKKIVRAINSVLSQTYEQWELLVISDGCQKTIEIVRQFRDKRIRGLWIDKKPAFSGIPRNTGIYYSKGDIITYLDVDDLFGKDHLKKIVSQFGDADWVYYDDRSYNVNKQKKGFIENPDFEDFHIHRCSLEKRGGMGTSNISHRQIGAWWSVKATYFHDFMFVNTLRGISKNFKYLEDVPEYCICHVPQLLDI